MDMQEFAMGRRHVLAGLSGLAATATGARAQDLPLPSRPVALNIMDVAGNLQLTQDSINRFATQNPQLVSRISFQRAPSPELPSKLRAQQAANRVDIDLVLTGPGAMSDGIGMGLWVDVWKRHPGQLPDPASIYHDGALMMQRNFGRDQGVAVVYSPSGPIFEYAPARLRAVPKTAAELLAWAKANPNRMTYARPVNSGPGWTFLMGMPYILGDRDPKDPVNGWDKTWAWLAELGQTIDHYPGGTAAMMKEFGDGNRDLIVSTCGWDINPRALGIVPKDAGVFVLDGTRWVPDTQFMAIPKGVPDDKVAVLLRLMSFLLQPEQQAATYDRGYFYPGPAVRGATLAMAPPESQAVIREFGRPEYDRLIAELPFAEPLTPDRLILAFRRWDEQIGAKATR
jgi:putative spermidine/putrescine transport system substrate-binding protein